MTRMRSLWSAKEQKEIADPTLVDKVLAAFWYVRVMTKQTDRIKSFIRFVQYEKSPELQQDIEKVINKCIETDNLKQFREYMSRILTVEEALLIDSAHSLNIKRRGPEKQILKINSTDRASLEEYLAEKQIPASIYIGNAHQSIEQGDRILSSDEYVDGYYAIHSVTKIFTGVLVLKMIEENVINEAELNTPIVLSRPKFIENLPKEFKIYFQQYSITLFQLMTHQSGLGDYLLGEKGYLQTIANTLEQKIMPPKIDNLSCFLTYADDSEPAMINKFRYSNVGFNLIGMWAEHVYSEVYPSRPKINFDMLLHQYVLSKAGLATTDFMSTMPLQHAIYNKTDNKPPYIVASPAAGHWVHLKGLERFAFWFYHQCTHNSVFKSLLEKWGSEFFKNGIVEHTGFVQSSSAFLSISLNTGNIIIILTNQKSDAAEKLPLTIKDHIHHLPEIVKESSLDFSS